MCSEIKINERRRSPISIFVSVKKMGKICMMFFILDSKLDSTIEPNSEIYREMNSFFYTCPTKPFKF